jgi:hypothetical protein
MTNLGEIWTDLMLAKTTEEQAKWARDHGMQMVDEIQRLNADAGIGQIELQITPQIALDSYRKANPRNPNPFG